MIYVPYLPLRRGDGCSDRRHGIRKTVKERVRKLRVFVRYEHRRKVVSAACAKRGESGNSASGGSMISHMSTRAPRPCERRYSSSASLISSTAAASIYGARSARSSPASEQPEQAQPVPDGSLSSLRAQLYIFAAFISCGNAYVEQHHL